MALVVLVLLILECRGHHVSWVKVTRMIFQFKMGTICLGRGVCAHLKTILLKNKEPLIYYVSTFPCFLTPSQTKETVMHKHCLNSLSLGCLHKYSQGHLKTLLCGGIAMEVWCIRNFRKERWTSSWKTGFSKLVFIRTFFTFCVCRAHLYIYARPLSYIMYREIQHISDGAVCVDCWISDENVVQLLTPSA
jgi:hypothetical protein